MTRPAETRMATTQRVQSMPATAVATERPVDDVADEDSADPAQQGGPQRDVVLVAGRDELAEEADDDASEEKPDELHEKPPKCRCSADSAGGPAITVRQVCRV